MEDILHDAIALVCETDEKILASTGEDARQNEIIFTHVPAKVSLIELIKNMGPYLTHGDGHVRRRATGVLAGILERAVETSETQFLTSKADSFRPLLSFFLERLGDYPSVPPCLRAAKALLRVVEAQPNVYPTAAVSVAKTMFEELHVQASDQATRQAAYLLLDYIVSSHAHRLAILGKATSGSAGAGIAMSSDPFALEFAVGVVQAIDGEKDPRCLLVALRVVEKVLNSKGPAALGDAVVSLTEELFDVTACYFPIAFSPPPNDPYGITKEQLVNALRAVFASSHRLAPFAIPLLLEKLNSSVLDSKRDALQTLRICAPVYGVDGLTPFLMDICSAVRSEVVHPRGSPEQGSNTPSGNVASIWISNVQQQDSDPRRIGISAGAVGMNYSGPIKTHDRTGYSLYSRDRNAAAAAAASTPAIAAGDASPRGPPAPPKPVVDDALDAICELSRVFSLAAQAQSANSGSTPQWWGDFVGMMVRTSVTEVERAAESAVGRASARVLCAIAAASQYALSAVLDMVMIVIVEVHADAHAHSRHTVHGAILSLAAGLLHACDKNVQTGDGQHPFSRHAQSLYISLTTALQTPSQIAPRVPVAPLPSTSASAAVVSSGASTTDADNCGIAEPGSGGAGSGAARLPPAPVLAGIAAISEKRCIAAAGLCSMVARAPQSLLSDDQVRTLVEHLTALIFDSDEAVRIAGARALCTMVTVRQKAAAAVLTTAVPQLLRRVFEPTSDIASAPDVASRPLWALSQIASTSNPSAQAAIIPELIAGAIKFTADGFAHLRSDTANATAVSAAVISALAGIVSMKASIGDVAAIDAVASGVYKPAGKTGSASAVEETSPAVPSLVLSLYRLLTSSVSATTTSDAAPTELPTAILAAAELVFRFVSLHASPSIQDSFRDQLASVLMSVESTRANGAADGSAATSTSPAIVLPSAPWFKPLHSSTLSAAQAHQQVALLPVLLTSFSVCRKSAPSPSSESLTTLISSLANSCFDMDIGTLRSCEDPALRVLAQQSFANAEEFAEAANETATLPVAAAAASAAGGLRLLQTQRAAVACAQTIGVLLNRTPASAADTAGYDSAVDALLQLLLARAGLGSAAAPMATPDTRALQTAILVTVYAAKGTAMRGHASSNKFISILSDLLLTSTTTSTATADSHAQTLAASGLGLILLDPPAHHPLHKDAGALINALYKQKLFGTMMQKYAALRSSTTAASADSLVPGAPAASFVPQSMPLMLALCSMASRLPQAVLLGQMDAVLPVVVTALETVGAPKPASAGTSAADREVRDAVAMSALSSLYTLAAKSPATVAAHVHTLVPVLLHLSTVQSGSKPLVRAAAIDCIRGFTRMPYNKIHPVRTAVIKGLAAATDDPKRAVRRRAAACRNDWLTMN